jgi:multidrug efflux pump subunit AcrB
VGIGRLSARRFCIGATLVTPREEEPQIDVTMADVFIAFPGASVQDVENLVATPAEQVLSRMSGVEHVYSVSRPGMAVVTVQFEVGVKYNDAVVRLYDTVHSNRDWLSPDLGVLEPVVKPRGIDDVPIVSLTFWSTDPERSAFDLQQVARAPKWTSSESRERVTCPRSAVPITCCACRWTASA